MARHSTSCEPPSPRRNTIKHPNLGAWAQHYLGESHDTLSFNRLVSTPVQSTETAFSQPPSVPYRFLIRTRVSGTSRPRGGSEALGERLALSEKLSSFFSNRYPDQNVKSYREFYRQYPSSPSKQGSRFLRPRKGTCRHAREIRPQANSDKVVFLPAAWWKRAFDTWKWRPMVGTCTITCRVTWRI